MKNISKNNSTPGMLSSKRLSIGLFILATCYSGMFAQSAVSAAGGNGSGSGGSVSYTVGQVTYTNFIGENGSIYLGVQQPNLFLTVGMEELDITLSASLFPNPTNASASLKLEGQSASIPGDDLAFRLYDLNGKLLMQDQIESEITTIPMDHLIGSVFVLQVMRKDKEVKLFKIFKTN